MEQDTILFRGKRLDNDEWVYGYYVKHDTVKVCMSTDDPKPSHYIVQDGFCDWGLVPPIEWFEVDPETVGQCTGMKEFIAADELALTPIFEGDIVELWSRRRIATETYWTQKSQYDGDCIVRAVIVFKCGEWRLDYNNKHNEKIAAARGNEMYSRNVHSGKSLNGLLPYGNCNVDFLRINCVNRNLKHHDIKVIGNIHDNPELVEE